MKKVFKVADIHELLKQVNQGEISYSRMVEIMNEEAAKAYGVGVENKWNNPYNIDPDKIKIPDFKTEVLNRPVVVEGKVSLDPSMFKGGELKWSDENKDFNPIERWQISKQAKLLLNPEGIISTQEFNTYTLIDEFTLQREEFDKIYSFNIKERFAKIESGSGWSRSYYEFETELIHNIFIPDEMSGNHSYNVQILKEVNPQYD